MVQSMPELTTTQGVQIKENRGPLPLGDFKITGGLILWISQIDLEWERCDSSTWRLEVRVRSRLPDRFDPSVSADVLFGRHYELVLGNQGELKYGHRPGEVPDSWVAHRIFETLEWLVRHEVAESVWHKGNAIVNAHPDDGRFGSYPLV